MRLSNQTIEDVFETGLHQFLVDTMSTNTSIANAIADDYRFHA